jgi:anhydro-N-acetylmuramic acid kinase
MVKEEYSVVGMMSGTSLDGMDLILCRFRKSGNDWHYEIIRSVTLPYPEEWRRKLTEAARLDAGAFLLLHQEYGRYIGNQVRHFLAGPTWKADLIASHGHTIFHQPEKGFTFQLGSGAALAATCKTDTVSDFRTLDVALGGQGAPLVPVGDALLFNSYDFCLNLGGFANISNQHQGRRIACDICPVNMVANHLAQSRGMEFDRDGRLGKNGKILPDLVEELNGLEFYQKPAPKSLGREWVEDIFLPVIQRSGASAEDALCSLYEHIAVQISRYTRAYPDGTILVTGGGAFNTFLMERIRRKSKAVLVIPDEQLVKFKEALIFAFLGLLRYRHEINCLASVTGAGMDSFSGVVHRVQPV